MKHRDPVKYIRDKAKAKYKKDTECYICGATEKLDFHHFYSLTPLLNKWLKDNKIVIKTDEDVVAIRDRFIQENLAELYDETVTLCHPHHLALHAIYGKNPVLATAQKQKRWCTIKRETNGLPIVDAE